MMRAYLLFSCTSLRLTFSLKIQELPATSSALSKNSSHTVWTRYFSDVEGVSEVSGGRRRRRRRRRRDEPETYIHNIHWTAFNSYYDIGYTVGVKVIFNNGPITTTTSQCGAGCGTPYLVVQNTNAGGGEGRGPHHLVLQQTLSTPNTITFQLVVPADSDNLEDEDVLHVAGNAIDLNSGSILDANGVAADIEQDHSEIATSKTIRQIKCTEQGTGSISTRIPCLCADTSTNDYDAAATCSSSSNICANAGTCSAPTPPTR